MSAVVLNAVLVSDSPAPGDADLVERFVVARDQAAFAELVRRHSEVVLGVWFWLTPIVWPADMIAPQWSWILDFNPAYYIVKGYRDSLVYGIPFWAEPVPALAFWAMCGIVLFAGAWVFQRLKPEFVEVL